MGITWAVQEYRAYKRSSLLVICLRNRRLLKVLNDSKWVGVIPWSFMINFISLKTFRGNGREFLFGSTVFWVALGSLKYNSKRIFFYHFWTISEITDHFEGLMANVSKVIYLIYLNRCNNEASTPTLQVQSSFPIKKRLQNQFKQE